VALVGGATGMIGDPSGKSAEREFLAEDILLRNQAGIRKQLEQFLDFSGGPNAAELVNNYDWFKNIGFLQFLREAGKHLTVNYMMAKDSVKKRLETAFRSPNFRTSCSRGTTFTTSIRPGACGSKWAAPTSGATSRPAPNSSGARRAAKPLPSPRRW
jgi:tyrosyl-tRNA synthetase